jgi:predicted outer membrane repeat protein
MALSSFRTRQARRTGRKAPAPSRVRLALEALEDRTVPSTLAVWRSTDNITERGTLRYAVAHAKSGDTILLAADLKNSPVVLSHGELLLDKDLTIRTAWNGPGTISGGGQSRVFEVAVSAHVTLSDLTITGGTGLASPNSVSPSDGFGGGLVNFGTLTVSDCTFTADSAQFGGGLYNFGVATINDTTFESNTADFGGGASNNSSITITGGVFRNNTATYNGGGLDGIGTAAVTGTLFEGNSATNGGGAFSYGGFPGFPGVLTVIDCTFRGNSGYNFGGGIGFISATGSVADSIFEGNTVYYDGGGIWTDGTLAVSGSTLSGNSAGRGGGIWNAGTLTVSGSTLSGNSGGASITSSGR